MDLQALPRRIFLDMLGFLPLEDRFRLRRVNRFWHRLCGYAITDRPAKINFFEDIFRKITQDDLRKLLRLCHNQLVEIRVTHRLRDFEDEMDIFSESDQLLETLCEFCYENLRRLNFNFSEKVSPTVSKIIARSPYLKDIKIQCLPVEDFVSTLNGISCDLEKIHFSSCKASASTFDFLGSHCKNLRSLNISCGPNCIRSMDTFFGCCTNLQSLELWNRTDAFFIVQLAHCNAFWRLSKLKRLTLRNDFSVDDQFLKAVSTSFPLLRKMNVEVCEKLTSSGLGALADMKHLADLEVHAVADNHLSEGLTAVCAQGRMKNLCLSGIFVNAKSIRTMVERCKSIRSFNVMFSDTVQNALDTVQLLPDRNMKMSISFMGSYYGKYDEHISWLIWELKSMDPDMLVSMIIYCSFFDHD